jgi:hypothetical protein
MIEGNGKFFVNKEDGAILFQNGSEEPIYVGDLNEDNPNLAPEAGILLDYFYIRHHIGHVNALAYVRDAVTFAARWAENG